MKVKLLVTTALLAIVALALSAPAVAQSLKGPGLGITWQVALVGSTPHNSGTAIYETFRATIAPPPALGKTLSKFIVETTTPTLSNGTKLDVFLGPGTTANEPYGKLVGTIEVDGGVGAMILIAAKVPTIEKGSTITVVEHGDTAAGEPILRGSF